MASSSEGLPVVLFGYEVRLNPSSIRAIATMIA